MATYLSEEFPSHKVTTAEGKYCLVKFVAIFHAGAAQAVKRWGKYLMMNNERSKEILKINYRPMKDTLVDMGYSLIYHERTPNHDKIDKSVLKEKVLSA